MAWTGPEDVWWEFIKDTYPRLHQQTHFLPPLHFSFTPHSVDTVAGQVVRVRDNPPRPTRPQGGQRVRGPPPPTPSTPQVAGQMFVENPAHLRPVRVQDSDRQDNEAQHRCLQALTEVSGGQEVMVVISQLHLKKYLDNETNLEKLTNAVHQVRIALLPGLQMVSSGSPQIEEGECDILIVNHEHSVLLGEIKSVGGSQFFHGQSSGQQDGVIFGKVEEAVRQLNKQSLALRCLLHDLPSVRITRNVHLPNVTSAQLRSALGTSTRLEHDLCRCMDSVDVNQAISRCLCKDHLTQPSTWWQSLWTVGPDPFMSPTLYERLVARFCGPATTVDIPAACRPRVVVRTLGQAVAETGLRFASLALTPSQVAPLSRRPRHLYLQGPPGCGKTMVLVLGALQSAQQGNKAWTGPEDVWWEFIKDTYPRLHQQTHFLPPLHFSFTPHGVDTVAGQVVRVRDNPPRPARPQGGQRVRGPPPPAPSTPQVAGQVFVENPAHLRPVRVQDSDRQDDEAQHRCLQALTEVSGGHVGYIPAAFQKVSGQSKSNKSREVDQCSSIWTIKQIQGG